METTFQKISVIITVFNKEDQIGRCIQSVLQQSYPNIDLIIVDDKSTDDSRPRISEAIKSCNFVRTVFFEAHEGIAKARNTGLTLAEGHYIFFLDGDDYLLPHALSLLTLTSNLQDEPIIALRVRNEVHQATSRAMQVKTMKWEGRKRIKVLYRQSAASLLFKRSFLTDHGLLFNEEFEQLADLDFMIKVACLAKTIVYVDCPLYIRGECLHPVDKPNMKLKPVEEYIDEYLIFLSDRYKYQQTSMELIEHKYDEYFNQYIERKFLRLYFKDISNWAITNEMLFDHYFEQISQMISTFQEDIILRSGKIGRLQIRAHLKGQRSQTVKWIKRRIMVSSWKKALTSRTKLYHQLSEQFFTKLPLRHDYIMFESFGGRSYSCNPRAISEEIQRQKPHFKLIWAFNKPSTIQVEGNVKKIRRLSFQYYFYMATSKYWITNARIPKYVPKRRDTIYIQTWHGTPLKKLAADMKDVVMPGTTTSTYKLNFYNEAKRWDYLISPNDYSSQIFKRAFHFEKEILEVGYPRNDLLFNEELKKKEALKNFKKMLGLPSSKKVILYAPTWRDNEFHRKGEYKFNLQLDLQSMKQALGENYIVILRMHYLIADKLSLEGLENFVYNLSAYPDISTLYQVTDILITDYSSVFFDFAILERPILFYTYDLYTYQHDLRGFYFDLRQDAPGPLLESTGEVIDAIKDIKQITAQYKVKRDLFQKRFCEWESGNAASQIINRVIK